MQKLSFAVILFLVFSNYSRSQCRLEIEIIGIRNNNGVLMLQLFDEKQKIATQVKKSITDQKCSFLLTDLKPGKYGVRFFHDENLSGEMETNLFGKPVEGYGFSNNATGKFGPPPFEKWLFEVVENKKIILKPVY
jgi:uncharacterized protein (DUF2141 family)